MARIRLGKGRPKQTPAPVGVAPVLVSSSFNITTAFTNGAQVGSVLLANTPDPTSVSYTIVSGNTSGAYGIVTATGVINVANSTQLAGGTSIVLGVQGDNGVSPAGTSSITVNVSTAGAAENVTSIQLYNRSASNSLSEFRFAHCFAQGDVPSTDRLALRVNNGADISYTAARRNYWPDGSLRYVDLLCNHPTGLAANTNQTIRINKVSGAFNDTLPNGVTNADVITDITTSFSDWTQTFEGMVDQNGTTVGSGNWECSAWDALNDATNRRVVATGPTHFDITSWRFLRDQVGGASHENLACFYYVTARLNEATGGVTDVHVQVMVAQPFLGTLKKRYKYRAKLFKGASLIRSWGYTDDNRSKTEAAANVGTGVSPVVTITGTNGFVDEDAVTWSSTGDTPVCSFVGKTLYAKRITADTFKLYWTQRGAAPEWSSTSGGWNSVVWRSVDTGATYSFGGKTFSGSAVDTATGVITLVAHGFNANRTFNPTSSTLTVTAGNAPVLTFGSDAIFWVRNTGSGVRLWWSLQDCIQSATNSALTINFTSQGTGNHTLQRAIIHYMYQGWWMCDTDGRWDWDGTQQEFNVVHDMQYITASGTMLPYDLTLNGSATTEAVSQNYTPGAMGKLYYMGYNAPSERDALGPLPNWAAMAIRNPTDFDGYVKTTRNMALGFASQNQLFLDPNGRIPVLHPTNTYGGLSSTYKTAWCLNYTNRSVSMAPGFSPASNFSLAELSGGDPGHGQVDDYSHHTQWVYGAYLREGGQHLLDLMMIEANNGFFATWAASDAFQQRLNTVNSVQYIKCFGTNEVRADAWKGLSLTYGLITAPHDSSEFDYFTDLFTSTFDWWLAYTANFSVAWQNAGLWDVTPTSDATMECLGAFMQAYFAMATALMYSANPTADALTVATHSSRLVDNLWKDPNCAAYSASYRLCVRPLETPQTIQNPFTPNDIGAQPGTASTLTFATNGTVTRDTNTTSPEYLELQVGDRLRVTTTNILSQVRGASPSPPSPLTNFQEVYVRNLTNQGQFQLATTNSDATIISSYASATSGVYYWVFGAGRSSGCPTRLYRDGGSSVMDAFGYLPQWRTAAGIHACIGTITADSFNTIETFRQNSPATTVKNFQGGNKYCVRSSY